MKTGQDLKQVVSEVASAMRRLATAASVNVGSDCYIHASIAHAVLARLGIESRMTVGYAAWRVGDGDSDVILHAPAPGMVPQPGGVAYHVWLELAGDILDLTTYALRQKAAQLDFLDGGKTTVIWCPDYFFEPKSSVSKLRDVIQKSHGLYYYSEEPALASMVISAAPELDQADVETAWILYQNQGLKVFGPNDIKGKQEKK